MGATRLHNNMLWYFQSNSTTSVDEPSVHLGHIIGDMSGVAHVGYKQSFDVASSSINVPTSFNMYEGSSLDLPNTTFFHQVAVRLIPVAYLSMNAFAEYS